jgi:hypothetical protein
MVITIIITTNMFMLITMENNHVFSVEEVCVEDLLGAQVRIKDFLEVKPWEPPWNQVEVLCLGKKKRDGSKLPKFTDGE